MEEEQLPEMVLGWEKAFGLNGNNLSNMKRMLRMLNVLRNNSNEVLNSGSGPLTFATGSPFIDNIIAINKAAGEGSLTASTIILALNNFVQAMTRFKDNPTVPNVKADAEFVKYLAACLLAEPVCAYWTIEEKEMATKIVERVQRTIPQKEKSEHDKNTRICGGYFKINTPQLANEFLAECIRKYPEEVYFYNARAAALSFLGRSERALREIVNPALTKFPNNVGLLYAKAGLLHQVDLGDNIKERIVAWEKYLEIAPHCERKVPEAYYALAFDSKGDEQVSYYEKGEEAEKSLLPCFLPFESKKKSLVKVIIGFSNTKNLVKDIFKAPEKENQNTESHAKLNGPQRIQIVIAHRKLLSQCQALETKLKEHFHQVNSVAGSKNKKQKPSTRNSSWKPITLSEMNFLSDRVYRGRVLKLTSIEDCSANQSSARLVVQDENGDVHRCCIYNYKDDESLQEKLGIGAKISIQNPYMKSTLDGKQVIRVDDPKLIIFHEDEKEVKKCRYCGMVNAPMSCSICTRSYCSKDCQVKDFKILKHKLICQPSNGTTLHY